RQPGRAVVRSERRNLCARGTDGKERNDAEFPPAGQEQGRRRRLGSGIDRGVTRTLAAALTPLTDNGARLDEGAVEPYLSFLAQGGADGVLACGTTGEGILLSRAERERLLELMSAGPLPVIAHCGAQSTADTVALAEHAAGLGVAGVAVIAPPYFM